MFGSAMLNTAAGMLPMGMQAMPPHMQLLQAVMQPGLPQQVLQQPGVPQMQPAPAQPTTAAQRARMIQQQEYQQAALVYEAEKHSGILPEIIEFSEHFGLDDRVTKALDDDMKRRKGTFDQDLEALYIGLEGAKNVAGLLMIKVKEMRMGTFRGMAALDRTVQDFGKKYKLDAQATVNLAEVMDKREDAEGDMKKLGKHLERSNKPSSLMMMMLKDLREGKPVKEPEYAAAVGSRVHEKELKDHDQRTRRSRSRDRDRGQPQRYTDRRDDRGRDRRSRDRDRDRRW